MAATVEKHASHASDGGEQVILVDSTGNPVGTAPKMEAHQHGGQLHLAISVVVFDDKGRMLIQRRSSGKYHSGGRWANTCCSHPRPGESLETAAHRRLREEMGFDCSLKEAFDFTYRIDVGGEMTEHEYDHVFVGKFDGQPHPSPEEVSEYRWVSLEELYRDVRADSKDYAPWFKIILVHLGEMDVERLFE